MSPNQIDRLYEKLDQIHTELKHLNVDIATSKVTIAKHEQEIEHVTKMSTETKADVTKQKVYFALSGSVIMLVFTFLLNKLKLIS